MDLICGLAAIFLSGLIYVKKLWFFLFVCGVVWWRDACSSLLTPPPIGEWSIVMSVSVCLCVCLSVSAIISAELHVRTYHIFCACYLWPWLDPPQAA